MIISEQVMSWIAYSVVFFVIIMFSYFFFKDLYEGDTDEDLFPTKPRPKKRLKEEWLQDLDKPPRKETKKMSDS